MKRGILLFFLMWFSIGFAEHINFTISIPQTSGLAFVNYKTFNINNGKLYEIEKSLSLKSTLKKGEKETLYSYDTLKTTEVNKDIIIKLEDLFTSTDSLGDHSALGCYAQFGSPRFYIYGKFGNKELSGSIFNCYRAHIFKFVDLFNSIYPSGDIISYSQKDLAQKETDCLEYHYGIVKKDCQQYPFPKIKLSLLPGLISNEWQYLYSFNSDSTFYVVNCCYDVSDIAKNYYNMGFVPERILVAKTDKKRSKQLLSESNDWIEHRNSSCLRDVDISIDWRGGYYYPVLKDSLTDEKGYLDQCEIVHCSSSDQEIIMEVISVSKGILVITNYLGDDREDYHVYGTSDF